MENAIIAGIFTILGVVITWIALSFNQHYENYRNELVRNRNIIAGTLKVFLLINRMIGVTIKEYNKTKNIANISSEFPDDIFIQYDIRFP